MIHLREAINLISQVTEDEHILEIAYEVREEVMGDEPCSGGMCLDASEILVERLKELGYDANVVEGRFEIDFPDPAEIDYIGEEWAHTPTHYWVEIGGKILDVTADQYEDEVEGEVLPEIVFGTYEENLRYLKGLH